MTKWASADYAYTYLRRIWYIPEEYTFEQAKKIMSIRQEVNLNNYRAYEPITIAYDVSQKVVSEILEHGDELAGVQVSQSTTRVYPRGTSAAHVLGYLTKSADTVTENRLISMGYTEEQLLPYRDQDNEGAYKYDENGNILIDMIDMGYSYSDYVGVSGIEYTMEAYLTGATEEHQGVREIEINKNGSIIRELSESAATDGNDVMLTIDIEMQAVCERALENLINQTAEKEKALIAEDVDGEYTDKEIDTAATGAMIVMDPRNSEVLAMASYPSYDPNWFIEGIAKGSEVDEYLFGEGAEKTTPMRNKAISARYTPGSIFKMITGIAGVAEGVIGINEQVSDHGDSGFYYFYNEDGTVSKSGAPRCWKTSRHYEHSDITLSQALTFSCNYYFCEVANRLGIDTLDKWAGRFGLTKSTGIELTGESVGICGGQDVLFDNELKTDGELSISSQKTSLPTLIYRRLCERLSEYMSMRGMEVDDVAVRKCALRLMELQDGSGLDGKGPEIRRILSDEIGIPEGYSAAQPWTSQIVTLLNEIQWKPTQTIRAGFGQGVTLVTPIAVARYVCAIANEGSVYNANIVDRITDDKGELLEDRSAELIDTIGTDSAEWQALWDAVKQGMTGVVSPEDQGTAADKFSPEFVEAGYQDRIAGKTGTAQIGLVSIDIEDTSWFISYTPREGEAELVVVICIPNGFSGSWSVSAAEEIYSYYFNKQDSAAPETLADIDGAVP